MLFSLKIAGILFSPQKPALALNAMKKSARSPSHTLAKFTFVQDDVSNCVKLIHSAVIGIDKTLPVKLDNSRHLTYDGAVS
jgi:hypothetical protein